MGARLSCRRQSSKSKLIPLSEELFEHLRTINTRPALPYIPPPPSPYMDVVKANEDGKSFDRDFVVTTFAGAPDFMCTFFKSTRFLCNIDSRTILKTHAGALKIRITAPIDDPDLSVCMCLVGSDKIVAYDLAGSRDLGLKRN